MSVIIDLFLFSFFFLFYIWLLIWALVIGLKEQRPGRIWKSFVLSRNISSFFFFFKSITIKLSETHNVSLLSALRLQEIGKQKVGLKDKFSKIYKCIVKTLKLESSYVLKHNG